MNPNEIKMSLAMDLSQLPPPHYHFTNGINTLTTPFYHYSAPSHHYCGINNHTKHTLTNTWWQWWYSATPTTTTTACFIYTIINQYTCKLQAYFLTLPLQTTHYPTLSRNNLIWLVLFCTVPSPCLPHLPSAIERKAKEKNIQKIRHLHHKTIESPYLQ